MSIKKAVILLSGGLDSSTALYYAKSKGYACSCLIFDYGQRHKKELKSAVKIARLAGCPYKIIKIKLPWQAGSLLNKKLSIPDNCQLSTVNALPSTYVPGRNTIFISHALSYAESINACRIFIGANAVDFSGYPDCRPDYYKAWNRVLSALGTGVRVETPLIKLTKEKIIRIGQSLKVPYGLTWSCYEGGRKPCGICDSCRFRAKGFAEAGIQDR
ncbi:MAG: 7-cyano-7-deazaguanine synthase QueC [Elusimicrobiota bacterium]